MWAGLRSRLRPSGAARWRELRVLELSALQNSGTAGHPPHQRCQSTKSACAPIPHSRLAGFAGQWTYSSIVAQRVRPASKLTTAALVATTGAACLEPTETPSAPERPAARGGGGWSVSELLLTGAGRQRCLQRADWHSRAGRAGEAASCLDLAGRPAQGLAAANAGLSSAVDEHPLLSIYVGVSIGSVRG